MKYGSYYLGVLDGVAAVLKVPKIIAAWTSRGLRTSGGCIWGLTLRLHSSSVLGFIFRKRNYYGASGYFQVRSQKLAEPCS